MLRRGDVTFVHEEQLPAGGPVGDEQSSAVTAADAAPPPAARSLWEPVVSDEGTGDR